MIADPTIRPAVTELERAYDTLANLAFTRQQMHPRPVIIIQSHGRRKTAAGWYSTLLWGPRGSHTVPEITICAETLYLTSAEIITTLVHEMVHHACAVGGVRDTTSKGYHNQHFRDAAEAAGLVVERDGPRGWARTTAGPTLAGHIAALEIQESAFAICRDSLASHVRKQSTRMLRWSCGCTTIRAATEVHATCTRCGQEFTRR